MPSDPYSQTSNRATFSGVEEFEEAARAFGWRIEYWQTGKGSFSAEIRDRECDGLHLASLRWSNHLLINCEPPEGFIGATFHRTEGRWKVGGRTLDDRDVIFFPRGSELTISTRNTVSNETMFVAEHDFLNAVQAVLPHQEIQLSGSARTFHTDPARYAAIQQVMGMVRRHGLLDAESASSILVNTILLMAGQSSKSNAERLSNGAATAIAKRARTYIEENWTSKIRLQDLCSFTGVGARTLQRCFVSHLQMTPTEYISVRRLNAARRDLAKTEPSERTVTQIAMDNGFTHLGRFSVQYRIHFGETPSDTLSRTASPGQ
jgi:AraC-like DNA-binding protein